MKLLSVILLITINCLSFIGFSQNTEHKGYRIEGDEVVFTFNKSDYDYLSNDIYHDRLEPSEVYIKQVAVAGEFNDWSRDAWRMKKVSNSVYEFRKKIEDFTDEFDWEFKFVINNHYWAEPLFSDINITPAKSKYGDDLHVYNLKLYTGFPSKEGNATFKLKGYKNARKVILSGTFNRWDEKDYRMEKTSEGWELTLQLKPNTYYYKFIINGNDWIIDPDNPYKIINEFGGYNSAISVEANTIFNLYGFQDANQVILAGSFNDWSEEAFKMIKTGNGWTFSTSLTGGKHHYKYIVDGNWITDPDNPVKEYDNKGNINSVKMVKD